MKVYMQRVWDFSYARTRSAAEGRNMMRWRDPESGEEIYCTEIHGDLSAPNVFIHGEGITDHMDIECGLLVDGETVFVTPPLVWPEDEYEPVQELPESHYRMCARLSNHDFRMRDERTGELRHVKSFRGPAKLNWIDHGTHVFTDTPMELDAQGIAHCAPEKVSV